MRRRKIVGCLLIVFGVVTVILRLMQTDFGEKILTKERMSGNLMVVAREEFQKRIVGNIGEEGTLGVAYLLGERGGLNKELEEIIQTVGLTHLVVASGTHLGILTDTIKRWFGKVSRFAGTFFSVVFILGFGEVIGWTASISRAAIVATTGVLGWYFGIELHKGKVLAFAMWITVMMEPRLVLSLGWQLSFAAYFGVIIVGPRLIEVLYPERGRMAIRERRARGISGVAEGLFPVPGTLTQMILISLGVSACVAPLLIYYFGCFSLASVIGTVILSPTLPVVMGLSFLAGMPGGVGIGAGWLAKWALRGHIFVMEWLGRPRYFLINGEAGEWKVFFAYLPLLIWIVCGEIIRARNIRGIAEKRRLAPERYLRWKMETGVEIKRKKDII